MADSDPRFLKSHQRLHDTIFRLAEERDITTLSVSEIAREAKIDRTTFYLHYADRQEFFDALGDALIEEFRVAGAIFDESADPATDEVVPSGLPNVFWVTSKHPALYRQLLNSSASFSFRKRLEAHFAERFTQVWTRQGRVPPPGTAPIAVRARYAAAGTLGVLRMWLDGAAETTDAEELGAWMWDLSRPLHASTHAEEPVDGAADASEDQ